MEIQGLMGVLDPVWADHSHRVRALSAQIGLHLGLDGDELNRLEIAALVHDIGKARIDPSILMKPARLNDAEWREIKRHPGLGYEMLTGNVHPEVAEAVLAHHERYDGLGYPFGLSGMEIPFAARVLAVADAFDAITSDRPYDFARPRSDAVLELIDGAGTQFDPRVVEAFLDMVKAPTLLGPTATRTFVVA